MDTEQQDPAPEVDQATAERLERAYFERREALKLEWLEYARQHGPTLALRGNMAPGETRGVLFEAWVVDQLAQLQTLAQEETLRRRAATRLPT